MKIQLKTPCTENWNKMLPTELGRFCQSCQKNVVDFTTMNFAEIHNYLEQNNRNVCARMANYQLENFNAIYQDLPTASNIRRWSLAAILSSIWFYPSIGQQTITEPEPLIALSISSEINSTVADLFTPSEDSVILKGKVLGPKRLKRLANVEVFIETLNIKTTTNKKGEFLFKIPKSEQNLFIHCSIHSTGIYVTPNKDYFNLKFIQKNKKPKPHYHLPPGVQGGIGVLDEGKNFFVV